MVEIICNCFHRGVKECHLSAACHLCSSDWQSKENLFSHTLAHVTQPQTVAAGPLFDLICRAAVLHNKLYIKLFHWAHLKSFYISVLHCTNNKSIKYIWLGKYTTHVWQSPVSSSSTTETHDSKLQPHIHKPAEVSKCHQNVFFKSTLDNSSRLTNIQHVGFFVVVIYLWLWFPDFSFKHLLTMYIFKLIKNTMLSEHI